MRPWRPLALLVGLVVAASLAFGAVDGLQHEREVSGRAEESIATLCARSADPQTPDSRQTVLCDASGSEALEFAVRATTGFVRPVGGFEVRGWGAPIDIALRLLAALLFGLFVWRSATACGGDRAAGSNPPRMISFTNRSGGFTFRRRHVPAPLDRSPDEARHRRGRLGVPPQRAAGEPRPPA